MFLHLRSDQSLTCRLQLRWGSLHGTCFYNNANKMSVCLSRPHVFVYSHYKVAVACTVEGRVRERAGWLAACLQERVSPASRPVVT